MKGIKGVFGLMGTSFLIMGLVFVGLSVSMKLDMFLINGTVFTVVGLVFLIVLLVGRMRRRSLEETGTRVTAQVVSVDQVYTVRINRRHPYVIHATCEHPYTRQTMNVKSEYLMKDPTDRIRNGQVTVLVDPMSDNRYYMETDGLQ